MHCDYVLLPKFTMIDSVLFIIFEFCLVAHRVSGCVCVRARACVRACVCQMPGKG